ncbi:MAG TPA: hypothetical protein VMR52_12300 [Dehalococcoidia bacterium]|nr:hypothetical protein [Dehalococcoidia bacterium]
MSLSDVTPAVLAPGYDPIAEHAHHWLIAGQNGPSSEGTCKSCGATKDFDNGYSRTYRTTIFLNRNTRAAKPTTP